MVIIEMGKNTAEIGMRTRIVKLFTCDNSLNQISHLHTNYTDNVQEQI